MVEIHGSCDSRFERVADAFSRCFTEHGDVGASVCFTIEGEKVVDLWGGLADPEQGRPWQEDTLAVIFSATKGIVAIAALQLVDRGLLDLDVPIATYWPGYAQNGKDKITTRQVMTHTAGVPFLDADLPRGSGLDWDAMVKACEEQKPEWESGTQLAYHAVTFGWIVGEVIRRVSGITVGQFIARNIAEPLGAEFHLGLPDSMHGLIAPWIIPEQFLQPAARGDSQPKSYSDRSNDAAYIGDFHTINSSPFLRAEIPAMSGCGNARGLATIFRPLALGSIFDGVKLVNEETLIDATRMQATGPDPVLGIDNAKRTTGMKLMWPEMGEAYGKRSFGHGGYGGHIAAADPESRMSFGYVMNLPWPGPRGSDPRASSLVAAARESISR